MMEAEINNNNHEVKFDEITIANRILIIEDSPLQARKLQDLLAGSNYYSEVANNGSQALAMANEGGFDLILMDMVLPDTSGLQLISHLKNGKTTHAIPIIMLSGTSDKENVISAIRLGANDYLTKPYVHDELILKIELHLNLGKAQRELLALREVKEKCFSLLAFDFKAPLNSVWEKTKLLAAKDHENVTSQLVHSIQGDAENIYRNFENLTWWLSLQLNKSEPMPEVFLLHTLVNDVADQYETAARSKNIKMSTDIDESLKINSDFGMLDQVIKNIVNNAIKYSHPGKTVLIQCRGINTNGVALAEINIRDEGVGFSPQDVDSKIHIETIKDKKSGTSGEHGLGIGLLVCKGLLDLLKGTIKIEDNDGKGSKVTVQIPVMRV